MGRTKPAGELEEKLLEKVLAACCNRWNLDMTRACEGAQETGEALHRIADVLEDFRDGLIRAGIFPAAPVTRIHASSPTGAPGDATDPEPPRGGHAA
jgi:hypothetical protein